MIRLGLIGEGISKSSAPRLHEFLGKVYGVPVSYLRIDAKESPDFDFVRTLTRCGENGYRGVNVTHPFKERVHTLVDVPSQAVARIGAINTVVFDPKPWRGFNTDYSGFTGAFKHRFGQASPGRTLIVGAGGVGKAIAFSLGDLGADEVWLYDVDAGRAAGLAQALQATGIKAVAVPEGNLHEAIRQADGLINGTPLGMFQHYGNPFPAGTIGGQRWAFDAVYTPMDTEFLKVARAESVDIMSGYDLFLFQGFHAFEIFTGIRVDPIETMKAFPPPEGVCTDGMVHG